MQNWYEYEDWYEGYRREDEVKGILLIPWVEWSMQINPVENNNKNNQDLKITFKYVN